MPAPIEVSIARKDQMELPKVQYLTERLFAPEHDDDTSPRSVWYNPNWADKFYVILLGSRELPIGIFYVGGPNKAIDVSWWIDSNHRNNGYASKALDALAATLVEAGVSGAGRLLILAHDGERVASAKLEARLNRLLNNQTSNMSASPN